MFWSVHAVLGTECVVECLLPLVNVFSIGFSYSSLPYEEYSSHSFLTYRLYLMLLLCINKGLRLWYCSISAFWHLIVSSKADHRSQLWLQEKQGVFSDLLEPRAQEVTSLWIIKDPRSKINSFTIKLKNSFAEALVNSTRLKCVPELQGWQAAVLLWGQQDLL